MARTPHRHTQPPPPHDELTTTGSKKLPVISGASGAPCMLNRFAAEQQIFLIRAAIVSLNPSTETNKHHEHWRLNSTGNLWRISLPILFIKRNVDEAPGVNDD